ncbi:MAG: MoaD/ThiS family protein [Desulfobacterales bacterium]
MIRVGDRRVEWHDQMTVSSLLSALGETYEYAVVRIDDRVVSRPNFDHTFVPDESQVYLIPLVAGG